MHASILCIYLQNFQKNVCCVCTILVELSPYNIPSNLDILTLLFHDKFNIVSFSDPMNFLMSQIRENHSQAQTLTQSILVHLQASLVTISFEAGLAQPSLKMSKSLHQSFWPKILPHWLPHNDLQVLLHVIST